MTENLHNFKVYKPIKSLNTPYDYWSIMQYNSFAFAKNTSEPTITTINNRLIPANVSFDYILPFLVFKTLKRKLYSLVFFSPIK